MQIIFYYYAEMLNFYSLVIITRNPTLYNCIFRKNLQNLKNFLEDITKSKDKTQNPDHFPVEPKPPAPLSVSESASESSY